MDDRISSYDTYPGNSQLLSNSSINIFTQSFNYQNQFAHTSFTKNTGVSYPRLYMAWAMDVFIDAQRDETSTSRYNEKGASYPLPSASYYLYQDPPGVYTTYPYDSASSYINNLTFTMEHVMLDSFPGSIYRDYIHTVIFEDSFDAPFVVASVV